MVANETPVICLRCNHHARLHTGILKIRKEAGLEYSCPHCGSDLIKYGAKPQRGKSNSQKRSQKQEKRAAKRTGGHVQPGSGNKPGAKGDVRAQGSTRLECKLTRAKSFSLKLADLIKIEEAAQGEEHPIFEIEFQGVHPTRRYVVLPGWLYDYFVDIDFTENS